MPVLDAPRESSVAFGRNGEVSSSVSMSLRVSVPPVAALRRIDSSSARTEPLIEGETVFSTTGDTSDGEWETPNLIPCGVARRVESPRSGSVLCSG